MIKPEVVSDIFERAHIEEVVGDFVHLKKRGANLIGLCPFHNERTPSFNVSPSKGIYKCFGCGKGGNSVNFIMEHEHLSYPEALKFLARKYGIEVEEKELSTEEKQAADARESLLIINDAASTFFQQYLKESDEGRTIGLSYFKERGMDLKMIDRFALGYCPEKKEESFTEHALAKGFKKEFLLRTGLSKEGQRGTYDFFHGRVMFPIRSISGRVLGFGGRTLRRDKQIAKYFNSPESEIYNKSKVLYGLYESKSSIVKKDKCYMVEGYMDVISLHQAGIENVVASSGTSLTEGQIRLIRRFTKNVVLFLDSDAAGVKASKRGINLLLEEDMSVQVVELLDGDDPDSLSQRLSTEELDAYLDKNTMGFFDYLIEKRPNDPIERAKADNEISLSLARMPDQLSRNREEIRIAHALNIETNEDRRRFNNHIYRLSQKISRERIERNVEKQYSNVLAEENQPSPPPGPGDMLGELQEPVEMDMPLAPSFLNTVDIGSQERDIIRILLNYGNELLTLELEPEKGEEVKEGEELITEEVSVEEYILEDLSHERHVQFRDSFCSKVWTLYQAAYADERSLKVESLMRHPDHTISAGVAEMLSQKHELHRWEERQIYPRHEREQLLEMVDSSLDRLKLKTLQQMIKETQTSIKAVQHDPVELEKTLNKLTKLNILKMKLSERFGTVILSA